MSSTVTSNSKSSTESSLCAFDSFSHSENMCSEKTCATHCTDLTHPHCSTPFCSVNKCAKGGVFCSFHCDEIDETHNHCAVIYCLSERKQNYVYCDLHCEDYGLFECNFSGCIEIKRCVYFSTTHDTNQNPFCETHCESQLHPHCKKINCKNLVLPESNTDLCSECCEIPKK